MRKKIRQSLVILAISLFAFMSFGCGTTDDADDSKKKDIVAETKETNGSDEADVDEKNEEANEASEEETEAKKTASSSKTTIEEQVLIDQDGIKITAKKFEKDSIWGDKVTVTVENSTDKDLTVSCEALIVNDYMISDLFVCEVAAGKMANDSIDLSSSELEVAGIESIGKIEVYFRAYDSSSYDEYFSNAYAEIHTSNFDTMDTTPNDAGVELYNEGGIRIVGKTVDEDSFWGMSILLYCENTSGKNVSIHVDDMSINGVMIDGYFGAEVYNNKKIIEDITLLSSELEENDITTIENVELKFRISDSDTYETIVTTDSIGFSAQ